MSAVFWIVAALLVVLSLGFLLWPLLRRRGAGAAASRRALNTAIYRDQIADLERDRASGAVSEADYLQAQEELKRRLLEDVVAADPTPAAHPPRSTRTAIVLLVVIPLCATLLYAVLGNPAGLLPQTETRSAPAQGSGGGGDETGGSGGGQAASAGPAAGDLNKMAANLAAKLEKNPDNPQGWAMLGRTYKAIGRYDDAEKAFKRAGSIMETESTLILEQAELTAIRNGGKLEGRPREMIERVLKKEPENLQALLLAGTAAYFRHDFANSVGYWERMLKLVPPASEDAKAITASIAKARSQMGGQRGGSVASALAPILGDGPAPGASNGPSAAAPTAVSGGATVSGIVDVAATIKGKAAPGDTVFIFARAAQGPRMPLAVLRVKVSDLPRKFTLDDSMAMSPELKLSSFGEVKVEARISKSGNAIPQSGDLSGSVGPVKPGATGIKLNIDQVVP